MSLPSTAPDDRQPPPDPVNDVTNPLGRIVHSPRPQPTIPGYAIDRELGRGGMGVVYLAWQLGLNRPVALKMMLAGAHASAEDLGRFHQEIQTVARLRHPNIVQIHDVGQHDGLPYCALEYLGGGSLEDRLAGKPFGQRQAAALLLVLARAVQAAHEAGIVHRDLKPANILFASAGEAAQEKRGPDATLRASWRPEDARVADFGVAKRLGVAHGMTATASVIGTPAYMAPEQASGRSREVGVAADVYSLGAMLYELLTGRTPFVGTDGDSILPQVLREEPVPPTRLVADLSRDLETICLKCLAKEPARRYASAAALAFDLERYLESRPITARPLRRAEIAWRWCRRNPAVASLLAVLAVVVVLGFAGVTWLWRAAEGEKTDKEAEAIGAKLARVQAENERLKAETHLVLSRIAQAHFLWERNDLAGARKLLDECPVEQREWEWHHLQRLCRGHLATAELPTWGLRAAVSPDGSRLVVACGDPGPAPVTLLQHRLPDLSVLPETLTGHVSPLQHFAFGDDGRLATLDGRDTARLLARDSLQAEWEQTTTEQLTRGWFSEDGRWLLRVWQGRGLRVWDTRSGKEGPQFAGHAQEIKTATLSATARLVAAVDGARELRVWDLSTGQELYRRGTIDEGVAFSPDGNWLAVRRDDIEVRVLRARTGQVAWRQDMTRVAPEPLGPPQFSPDGRWLVTQPYGWPPRVWEAATGLGGHFLRGHEGDTINALSFSPDGRWTVTSGTDRTLRLWEPGTGRERRVYRGHTAPVTHHCFSHDGRRLISVGGGPHDGDNRVCVWDLTRDQHVLRLPAYTRYWAQTVWNSLLEFSPEGRLLVGYSVEGLASYDAAGVRREEWHFPCTQDPWSEWNCLAVSADTRFVAGRSAEGTITRMDLGSREKRVWKVGAAVRSLTLSPDGRRIAAGTRAGRLLLWDVEAERVVYEREVGPMIRLAFDATGRRLAVGTLGLCWLDVDAGTLHRPDDEVKGAVVGLAFHPNGRWLACSVIRPGEIRLYDTTTGELVRNWFEPRVLGDVAFHPSGNRLAVASREGFVTLYDPRNGLEVLTLRALTGRERDLAFPPRVAFSADGNRLATNDYRTGFWIWESDGPSSAAASGAFEYHLQAAAVAQELEERGVFAFHRAQLKRLAPPNGKPQRDLAALLAREQDWAGAATAMRSWLESHPRSSWVNDWHKPTEILALSLLLSGDQQGYRELCRRLNDESGAAEHLLRVCSWGANALEPAALKRLVHRQQKRPAKEPLALVLLGLAQARAADRAEAEATLEKALATGKADPFVAGTAHLALALLHHHCGRAEAARRHRLAATELEEVTRLLRHPNHEHLNHWMALQALSAEVRQTLPKAGE